MPGGSTRTQDGVATEVVAGAVKPSGVRGKGAARGLKAALRQKSSLVPRNRMVFA